MPSLPTSSHQLPRGRVVGMGWGGWERRCPPRGAQHLLCSAGSVCQAVGGKELGATSPLLSKSRLKRSPPALRASAVFFREVVRKGNFWELVREGCGAKRDEYGNATPLGPGVGLPRRDQSQWARRAGSGAGVRSPAAAAAAAAWPGGVGEGAPQAQFLVRPRGGAGAADQVTERSSWAAGSCLVLSRRRRRRRRHT